VGPKPIPVSVFILDDHLSVREGVRAILDASGRYKVVGLAASSSEARTALEGLGASASLPRILIADINLKGQNGIDFVRELRSSYPELACVMISVSIRFDSVIESMAAGARGYLGKDQDEESMLRVLDAVMRGEPGLEGEVLRNLIENAVRLSTARMGIERSRYDSLTPREKEVFRLTALNRSVHDIADELGLTPKSVENVKSQVFGKLAVQDRFELYRYALRIGIIEE
jgi:DNA-binding NarL/FixJ family response regulator